MTAPPPPLLLFLGDSWAAADRYAEPEQCAGWASNGECTRNPKYMLDTCPRNCAEQRASVVAGYLDEASRCIDEATEEKCTTAEQKAAWRKAKRVCEILNGVRDRRGRVVVPGVYEEEYQAWKDKGGHVAGSRKERQNYSERGLYATAIREAIDAMRRDDAGLRSLETFLGCLPPVDVTLRTRRTGAVATSPGSKSPPASISTPWTSYASRAVLWPTARTWAGNGRSLRRGCPARARSGTRIHASRPLRGMIARPKISERNAAESLWARRARFPRRPGRGRARARRRGGRRRRARARGPGPT